MVTKNACCILMYRGYVLMVRERHNKKWTVPGGGKDAGETDFEAMAREYREETGMRLPQLRQYKKVLYGFMGHTAIFIADNTYVNINGFRPNNEIDGIGWVPLQSLLRYNFSWFPSSAGLHEVRGVAQNSFRFLRKNGYL